MGRKAPRIRKAKTSKRVSTVKVGKIGKTTKVKKVKVEKRKKVRGQGGLAKTAKGSVATTVAGPSARNTGNVVRNTLAATRKRVAVSNLGIRDTSPLG